MKVSVTLDNQGLLPDKYAKFAPAEYRLEDNPVVNFPIAVSDAPAGTETLAIAFIDYDAIPVGGFPWIHWCAYVNGDFEGDIEFPDDLSRNEHSRLVQGYNSAAKSEPERGVGYVGPCPPDRDHKYTLQVIALDDEPLVEAPFWANELLDACRGHAIDEAGRILPSRC